MLVAGSICKIENDSIKTEQYNKMTDKSQIFGCAEVSISLQIPSKSVRLQVWWQGFQRQKLSWKRKNQTEDCKCNSTFLFFFSLFGGWRGCRMGREHAKLYSKTCRPK